MKRWLQMLAVLGAVAAVGGGLVVLAGVVPIAASSGHWAITEWFLQLAKMRSVATHSMSIELPRLDDRALVLRGGKHYESGCGPCHGTPDHKYPTVPGAMLPPPPYLPERLAEFAPEELFYIVKHGIKFTGMPSWPAQSRDDEVHAVVAFLLALPKLDAAGYRALTGRGDDAADGCKRCHTADGSGGPEGAFPSLAGQRVEYTFNALDAYARGGRPSGIMQPIAAAMSEDEMRRAAEHYAKLSVVRAGAASDSNAQTRGQQIATHGVPEQNVPACAECHGPRRTRRNAGYPRLAGQHAGYLVQQLELFRARVRGGSKYAHLMDKVAPRLSDAQMRDVAAYYASLGSDEE